MPMFNPVVPSGLTIGSTAIASGTTTKLLYDNAGVVAEANIFAGTNIVELRTSTSAQKLNVYNSYTDASNYAFGFLDSGVTTANTLTIGTTGLGTGATTLSKLQFNVLGINYLDYNVTSPTKLTSKNPFQAGGSLYVSDGTGFASANLQCGIDINYPGILAASNWKFGWASTTNISSYAYDTALARNAAGIIEINNGTAGAFRDLKARNVITNAMVVASLIAAATAGAGARSFVTDATAPTFGATVAGGGAVSTPVYSDGSAWKVG